MSTAALLGFAATSARLRLTATRLASGNAEPLAPIIASMLAALTGPHSRLDPLTLSGAAHAALHALAGTLSRTPLLP